MFLILIAGSVWSDICILDVEFTSFHQTRTVDIGVRNSKALNTMNCSQMGCSDIPPGELLCIESWHITWIVFVGVIFLSMFGAMVGAMAYKQGMRHEKEASSAYENCKGVCRGGTS